MTNLKLTLTLLSILLSGNCYAKPHDLNLVLINGSYSITEEQSNSMIQLAAQSLGEASVGFRRIRKLRVNDKCVDKLSLAKSHSYFSCQKKALQKFKFSKNKGYIHFIAPPMVQGNFGYVGGYSDARCVRTTSRVHSIGNAINVRMPSGLPGLPLSSLVMAHELGHSSGAGHDNSVSVMHPNAGYHFNQLGYLPWSQASKNQIKGCLK